MRKSLLPFLMIFFLGVSTILVAQPAVQWDKTIGGISSDNLRDMYPTADGGFILAGTSSSNIANEKSEESRERSADYWLVKLAADGTIQWDKTYGGSGSDLIASVEQTTDGGYIIGGISNSGADYEKSAASRGGYDYWIIKVNAQGAMEWDRTLGGSANESLVKVKQLPTGEFIAIGNSLSGASGNKSASAISPGISDFWIVKLSASGSIVWDKVAGTAGYDQANNMNLTSDGGMILCGTQERESIGPYYIMKLDANGVEEWSDSFGSVEYRSYAQDIQQTPDGGYILGGWTYAYANQDQSENAETGRYWIIKLDNNHQIKWEKVYGTPLDENEFAYPNELKKIVQTPDGGYLMAGDTRENPNEQFGQQDYWIVKVDSLGVLQWDKTIGGTSEDWLSSACLGKDGGYLLGGYSFSGIGGIKTEAQRGLLDFWVVKLAPEAPLPVRLASFTARKELGSASLTWQTASEAGSDHFEVEHSVNAKIWSRLADLRAKGESNALQAYQFTHHNPINGDNYYRLKIIDTDGTFTYSKLQQVKFEFSFDILVYPNPVTETIYLNVADWSKVKEFQVLNSQGKALYKSESTRSQTISAKTLKPGLYFIKLTLTDGTETTRKIAVGQ